MESSLLELEQRARRLVSGIDWNKLEQQSRGLSLDPNIPITGDSLSYIPLYLAPAFEKSSRVMNTLYFDPHIVMSATVKDAMAEIGERISRRTGEIIATLTAEGFNGMLKLGIELTVFALRDLISLVWGVTMTGIRLHAAPYPIITLGRAKWREQASLLVMMMEAIVLLDDIGILTPLKWDSDTMQDLREEQGFPRDLKNSNAAAGLGALPVLAIIIGAVSAVVLIAGIWIWSKTTLEMNTAALDRIETLCKDPEFAKANGTACLDAINDARKGFNPFGSIFSAVGPYLFAGAILAAGIYFAPVIVPKIRGAMKAAKTP